MLQKIERDVNQDLSTSKCVQIGIEIFYITIFRYLKIQILKILYSKLKHNQYTF